MALSDWSSTAANNSTVLGTSIAEGCPPGNINNALRQAMADVAGGINYSVIGPVLSAASLSAARSALGVASPTSSTSLTNLGNVTNVASKLPYMTGGDAWSTVSFPSFGRSLVASGDAATALALLGITGSGAGSGSFSANAFTVTIPLGTGGTLLVQGGTGSLAGNTSSTITFGTAFSVAPVCIVNGGSTNISNEGDVHNAGAASTTGITIANSAPSTDSYTWLAIGKA